MIPKPRQEYTVVWAGDRVSTWGEKGSLLPPSHNVSSTWRPTVQRLRQGLDEINKRGVDG
jgi:hypothetical protein